MPRKHKSTATSGLPAAALRSFSEAGAKAEAAPGMGKPGMGKPGMGKPGSAAWGLQ